MRLARTLLLTAVLIYGNAQQAQQLAQEHILRLIDGGVIPIQVQQLWREKAPLFLMAQDTRQR
jgi:hypothetical protein